VKIVQRARRHRPRAARHLQQSSTESCGAVGELSMIDLPASAARDGMSALTKSVRVSHAVDQVGSQRCPLSSPRERKGLYTASTTELACFFKKAATKSTNLQQTPFESSDYVLCVREDKQRAKIWCAGYGVVALSVEIATNPNKFIDDRLLCKQNVRSEASKQYDALLIHTKKLSEACDRIYRVLVRNWLIE
jgi:hypothetical protein